MREVRKRQSKITKSTWFFFVPYSSMFFFMFRIISAKLKIFNSIIVFNFINMVNMLSRQKISSDMFFHNKPMFHNVFFSPGSIGMVRNVNKNIAIFRLISAFKVVWLFTFFKRSSIGRLHAFKTLVPSNSFFHNSVITDCRQNSKFLCTGATS